MKRRLFCVQATNRKPSFDTLEADVNAWLADHPNVVSFGIGHYDRRWRGLADVDPFGAERFEPTHLGKLVAIRHGVGVRAAQRCESIAVARSR